MDFHFGLRTGGSKGKCGDGRWMKKISNIEVKRSFLLPFCSKGGEVTLRVVREAWQSGGACYIMTSLSHPPLPRCLVLIQNKRLHACLATDWAEMQIQ